MLTPGWLLRDVLRKEWGFKGFVVSDYYAIYELSHRPESHGHFVAKDKKQACALAVQAGVNIELPEPDCYLHLVELVRKGVLQERQLDELVAPMLFWKFQMGLFDDPYVDPDDAAMVVGCEAHTELALQAARESITLLKNEARPAAVMRGGRYQDHCGDRPQCESQLAGRVQRRTKAATSRCWTALRAQVGKRVKVAVAVSEGCKITIGGSWKQDEVIPSDAWTKTVNRSPKPSKSRARQT